VQMLKAGAKPSMIYEAIRDENGEPTVTRKDISNLDTQIYLLEENASMEALITNMKKRRYIVCSDTWISDESEKSYIWMLEKLFSLMFFDIVPSVFVTDNDATLIDDSYDEIIKIVELIIYSGDCESLNLITVSYKALASSNLNANKAIKYLNRKNNESAHLAMRHAIESSRSLMKSFNSLDRWLYLYHEERLLQYENESINIDPLLTLDDKNRLEPFLGKVAQFALNKIKNELLKATIYKACLSNDIDQVYDPKSDRNCRFRALAFAIRGNKKSWCLIKLAMNSYLNKHIEVYEKWLNYNINLLIQILESQASLCSPSLWFLSPNCAQLAADTFSIYIANFDEDNKKC
ncbi:16531_t:CDS:2, partial [Cetraspora pellucida]